jgi:four helix bundle protein
MQGFRELRVWQSGMDLTEGVYRLTKAFPKHELYGLAAQMQRAAVSIPSNIAEGHSRHHLGEYLHHLSIARGSLAELETQLELTRRLDYATTDQIQPHLDQAAALGRQLVALQKSLQSKAT